MQLVQDDAPTPLYLPATQLAQVALDNAPSAPLYLPATQLVQDDAPVALIYTQQ